MHNIPGELQYTEQHIWIEPVGGGKFRAGITDFAQDELGDIVFVELPELGKEFAREDECAVVESVKSTSDIYCPLTGKIVEHNPALEDSPELINSDSYGEGWLFILEAVDESEIENLLDAEAYTQLTEEE